MEGRANVLQQMGKQALDGLREMSPERVFAGIGVVTVGVFLAERAYNLYQSIHKRNQLTSSDLDTINKELEHIHILTGHALVHQQNDSLGTSLNTINDAIQQFHQLLREKNAEGRTAYRYDLANLLCQRAQVQYLLGDLKKAETDLLSAISYNSSLIAAHNFLAHLYADGPIKNIKLANYYLTTSEKLNREQVFVRLQRALAQNPADENELNTCLQLFSTELHEQLQRLCEALPAVIIPDLMVRCMTVYIAHSNHLEVIQNHALMMQVLLKQNGLVTNKQLRFQLMESMLTARARMVELMQQGEMLQVEDASVFEGKTLCIDNVEEVGFTNNTDVVSDYVWNEIIRLHECDTYLLNPICREELTALHREFGKRGYFANTPELLRQVVKENDNLSEDEASPFVSWIKKQGCRLWFETIDFQRGDNQFISLFNIACQSNTVNVACYNCHDQKNLQLQQLFANDGEERNTLRVLVNPAERKLQMLFTLQKKVEKQLYLVVKGCEELLLHFPDKQDAVNSLLHRVQYTNTRKPMKKSQQPSSAFGFFSEHAVECLVVGSAALAITLGALRK